MNMANKNGMIWKIVGTIITLTVIAAGVVAGYTTLGHQVDDNADDIETMEPEVQKNSEYRIQNEVDLKYIKEKISNIETVQQQILEEVQK